MVDYIIKSGLCLVILLALYRLFLEKEKMHRFNRFFLLFSLAFGLLVPLVTLEIASNPLPPVEFSTVEEMVVQPAVLPEAADVNQAVITDTSPDYTTSIIFIIYGLGVCILLGRFILNLAKIASSILKHPRLKSDQGTIILLKENVIPHSFLNYIFLNEETYLNKGIEEQIVVHELTHVNQKHSIDILIAELLKIVFWFNPVFIFYKNAMQLNHEFLADESVVVSSNDVPAYQSLLLQAAGLRTFNLANNFNYSLTKKRLKMMKKHSSKMIVMLKEIALIPLLIVLVFLFSKTIAQSGGSGGQSSITKDDFYKGFTIGETKDGKYAKKKYEEMTAAEKSDLPSPKSPAKDLMKAWKKYVQYPVIVVNRIPEPTDAPEQCRIFIDGENVESKTLDKYRPSDFVSYSDSKFLKGGFTLISVNLYTNKYVKSLKGEAKFMMIYDKQTKVGRADPPFKMPAKYRATPVKN